MYALIVEGKEARSANGTVMAEEGEKFLVVKEPEGWVEADSCRWDGSVGADVKKFSSREAAEKFARKWDGFPWWCVPNGNFEVVEIRPKYVKVLDGYEVV